MGTIKKIAKKSAIKGISLSIILVAFIFIFAFTAGGLGDVALAWGPPNQYGNPDFNKHAQSSMINISSFLTRTASNFAVGVDSSNGTHSRTQWHLEDTTARSATYVETVKLSDNLYHALLNGRLSISATVTAHGRNDNIAADSTRRIRAFISIGNISGTGLGRDDFTQTASASGGVSSVTGKDEGNMSSTATYTSAPSSGQYIRYGMTAYNKSEKSWGSTSKGQINDIKMTITIAPNNDSDNPTITASSANNSRTSGTEVHIAENSKVTIADTGAGLWKYEIGGVTRKTYANTSTTTTKNDVISLTQADNGKVLKVYDNLGRTTEKTIRYYNPTVYARNSLDGSLVSNTTPGSVRIDTGAWGYSVNTSGKTIGSYSLQASPNDGYYLDSWQKTTGSGQTTIRTNTTYSYSIPPEDYPTSPIYWQANFMTISTTNKTVVYNGQPQNVDAPTNVHSNYTIQYSYKGTLENGQPYNSNDSPIFPGTYSTKVAIMRNSTEMGYKNVTLTITKRPITISANNISKTYGNQDPALTHSIGGSGLGTGDTVTGSLVRAAGQTVGTYTISQNSLLISRGGSSAMENYVFSFNNGTFTINKRPITISADHKSVVYGEDTPLTSQITSSSLAYDDYIIGGLTREVGIDVGSYYINQGTLSISAIDNYTLTYVRSTYVITKRPITISAQSGEKFYGETDKLYFDLTGELQYDDIWVGELSRDGSEDVGSYAIRMGSLSVASGSTPKIDNYDWSFVSNTYVIKVATPFATNIRASMTYESPLEDKIITATVVNPYNNSEVAGVWSWNIAEGDINRLMPEVSDSGSYLAIFTPTDTHNYMVITATAELIVNRQTQLLEFTDISLENGKVKAESQAPHLASYEVSYDNKTITLTAYTTAIYPTARPIDFTVSNPYLATIVSEFTEIVTIDGISYSKTTAILQINDIENYGILEITASQLDSSTNPSDGSYREYNLGNYINAIPASYKLYIKRVQIAQNFTDIALVYGDAPIILEPFLNSGRIDFSLVSENTDIATISENIAAFRTLTIHNAGTTKITVSHPGYVNTSDIEGAYMAFSATVTLTVSSADLTITLNDTTITYGETPNFTYRFDGLQYSKNENEVLNLTALVNTYDSVTMKDVIRLEQGIYGSYTGIMPSGASNIDSRYQNYNIQYEQGTLTILPKTVVATIGSNEKFYGDINPVIPIEYQGFIEGEDENTSGITPPQINYGSATQFSNVGVYIIKLSGGYANNYEFDTTDTGTLTINRVYVNIELIAPSEIDYSGLSPEITSIISGLNDLAASQPVNRNNHNAIRYEFLPSGSEDSTLWTQVSPVNVGSYDVKVIYSRAGSDNYETTEKVFESSISILPVNPVLRLNRTSTDYTSYGITVQGEADRIENGNTPQGNLLYEFSTREEALPGLPINAGTYTVKVIYLPAEVDNYKMHDVTFEDILTIERVNVEIVLYSKTTTYASSNGETPDRVVASPALALGVGDDQDKLPQNRFSYEYLIDNDWVGTPPTDAGTYPIRVTYEAYENENYLSTIATLGGGVIINPAPVSISLEQLIVDYNGDIIEANPATHRGITGGSEPLGFLSYEYQLGSSSYSALPVRNASTYNVRVIYTSVDGDNYADTAIDFSQALIIEKIIPNITLPSYKFEFDGRNRSVSGALVTGIENGSEPRGNVSYNYVVDGIEDFVGPRNVGEYAVKVTYHSGAEDNYKTTTIPFESAITIVKARPEIFLETRRENYTGTSVSAYQATIRGKTHDLEGPSGDVFYEYYIDGIWTDEQPTNSGSYNVKVIFVAIEGTNYSSIERICTNSLIIRNIAPDIGLETKIAPYNGYQITANTAIVNSEHGEAQGTWSYEYNMGGNSWTTRAPINAGSYHVMVRYNEAEVDNYSTKTEVFYDALIITMIDITVTPLSNQSKVYDGLPVDEESIAFDRVPLLPGNEWSGALWGGDRADAGEYRITLGSLSAGNNYNIIFTEDILYTILKREVDLIFPVINNVFDNTNKQPIITVDTSKLVEGDLVQVFTRYEGDTLNVGSFVAIASLTNNNYSLPANHSREYVIAPAIMTGNSFISYETTYNKKPHSITLNSVVEGATVVYDSPTEYIVRGVYPVTATITKPNYFPEVLTATLTINKGIFNVITNHPTQELYYGDDLPQITCNIAEGRIYLNEGQQLIPGEEEYSWTFEPFDRDNYEISTGTISLKVNKSVTTVEVQGALTQYADSPQKLQVNVLGGGDMPLDNAEVVYLDMYGEVYSSLPTAPGRYTMNVRFLGDELHEAVSYTTVIVVKEKASFGWIWVGVGVIIVLVAASAIHFINRSKRHGG